MRGDGNAHSAKATALQADPTGVAALELQQEEAPLDAHDAQLLEEERELNDDSNSNSMDKRIPRDDDAASRRDAELLEAGRTGQGGEEAEPREPTNINAEGPTRSRSVTIKEDKAAPRSKQKRPDVKEAQDGVDEEAWAAEKKQIPAPPSPPSPPPPSSIGEKIVKKHAGQAERQQKRSMATPKTREPTPAPTAPPTVSPTTAMPPVGLVERDALEPTEAWVEAHREASWNRDSAEEHY